MSEWKEYSIGDLVTFQRGHDLPREKMKDGIYPVAGSNSVIGLHNSYTTEAPGITIGRSGNIGNPQLHKTKFWAHNTTLYVKEFKKVDPTFFYYLLKTLDFSQLNSGSAVPSLNRNFIHPFKVSIPNDVITQRGIAEILSSLDDKIELNNKINQELESLAQLLFKRWFVYFEFPNKNGEPYKSSGGEMVDSELGEIPKGWEVFKFKEIVEKYIDNRGKTPPSSEFGIPLVEVKHMSDNEMFPTLKTDKYLSQEVYDTFLRGYLEEKDILMSTVGTIGRLNLVRGDEKFAIAQNVLGVRFNKKFVSQYFMYFQMKSKQFNEEIKSRLIETVQSSIKRSDIEKIPIKVPMSYLVEHFDEQVDSIVGQIAVLSKENQNLKILRDTLLPRLISGEIQINEN
jgi:type I restriction enzyme S subunit